MSEATLSVHEWPAPERADQDAGQDVRRGSVWLRRLPFRVRLTLSFAVVMVVLFGGLALLLQTRFSASLDQGIDRSLHTHAADLAVLVRGKAALPDLPESGGAFAQIVDVASGRVRDATPGHATPLLSLTEVRRAAAGSLLADHGGNARLLAMSVATRPPGVLVVAASLSQRNRALTALSELLFIGGPVILILTCLAGYGLAARALAPVEKMSARAARISGAPRGERLPVPEARDELHRLGDTLNAMLGRLEDALGRERAFVACAGHELRTPLAILKLELELALSADSSREQLQSRLRSVAEEVERLAKLAQDLLFIARAEQERLPLEKRSVEVGQILAGVAARFATSADGKGRSVRIESHASTRESPERLAVRADHERLEQALTNMVSNALAHGDGPVVLRAKKLGGSVELHVLDEGRGFDPAFLPRAFERFTRADPARLRGGTGLGLSIVRVIAEAHGGRACAANRESGGADVWLELPGA